MQRKIIINKYPLCASKFHISNFILSNQFIFSTFPSFLINLCQTSFDSLYQLQTFYNFPLENRMGSQIQKSEKAIWAEYAPPLQQYKLKYCGINYYVWEHSLQSTSLIQFSTHINQYMLKQQIDIFLFRHRHHLLVSTQYFRQNQQSERISIFYERVFTNLSRIRDLSFQDILQFYYVGLKGFEALYRRFGYFQIEDNMFHITKNSKIKVWCHKDISKSKPQEQEARKSTKRTEEEMVKRIIRIIDQNSDLSGNNFPIGSTLYEKASSSFVAAIQKFRQICNEQNIVIQERLACIDVIGKGQIGALLDEYGQVQTPTILEPQKEPQKEGQQVNQTIKNNLQTFAISTEEKVSNENANNEVLQHEEKKIFQQPKVGKNKKSKGLKVSHSLQKVNSKMKQYTPQRGHLLKESPIKELENENINAICSNQSQNYPVQRNLYHGLSQENISRIKSPTQQNGLSNIQIYPSPSIIRSGEPLIRRNSVDGYTKSHQYRNGGQYRIMINYANRPGSVIYKPSPPPQFIIANQRNQINFPVSIPPNPSASRLKHLQNLKNIQNAYSKTEKALLMLNKNHGQQISNPFIPNYRQFEGQKENKQMFRNQNLNEFNQRTTLINKLSQLSQNSNDFQNYRTNETKEQPLKGVKDENNFKNRFDEYKKGFNYEKKQTKYDTKYQKEYNNYGVPAFASENTKQNQNFNISIQPPPMKNYNPQDNLFLNQLNSKPFFAGILKNDTVISCVDSNGFSAEKQQSSIVKNETGQINKSSNKKKYENIPVIVEFPSSTDISDNTSSAPINTKTLSYDKTGSEGWREQSMVINHDPNASSIKMPEGKQYRAKIDNDIWADMQKVRQKGSLRI